MSLRLRYFILTACIGLLLSEAKSQSQVGLAYADSIKQSLRATASAKDSIKAYKQMAGAIGHIEPEQALSYYATMLDLARRNGDHVTIANAHASMVGPLLYTNQADSAERSVRESIVLFERLKVDSLNGSMANALMNLALLFDMNGKSDSALVLFRRALPLTEDNAEVRARLRGNMGAVYGSLNQMDSALAAFTSVVDYAREANNKRLLTMGLNNVALVQLQLGRAGAAVPLIQEQVNLSTQQGDSVDVALALSQLCNAYHELDSVKATQTTCGQAYRMGKRLDVGQAWSLAAFILSERLNSTDPAQRKTGLGLMAEVVEARRDAPWADGNDALFEARYAELLLADGQLRSAYTRAVAAVEAKRSAKSADPMNSDRIYRTLARAEYATGRFDSAEVHLAQATAFAQAHYAARLDDGVAAAETQFRTRETERALSAERDLRISTEQASRAERRLFFVIGALGLLLLGGGVYAFTRISKDRARISEQSAERAVLLREIHHRVKNNLQVIAGLLAKQGRTSSNEEVKAMMQEGQSRVHSMALVHQSLYEQNDLRTVAARTYFTELAQSVRRGQSGLHPEITLDLHVDEVDLDMDRAIPLGLILNELITNAFKHAFSELNGGRLRIAFTKTQTDYKLVVEDSGKGLPDNFEGKSQGRLGINLVRGLTRQLRGQSSLGPGEGGRGTRAEIRFEAGEMMAA